MRRFMIGLLLSLSLWSTAQAQTAQDVRSQLDARDKKALASAEAYTKANPKNAEAWTLLARARLQAGKAESAVQAGEKAVALAPNSAQAQYWLGNAYGERIGQVGMLSKMGMAPKLRNAFENAVRLDPDLLQAREALVVYYLQAPAAVGGGLDKAKAQVREIAKRDPFRGYLSQAQIEMSEQQFDAAVKSYRSALALKPGDKDVRMRIGLLYQQQERWADAFAYFRAWVAKDPDAGVAWYQIGRTSVLGEQQLPEGIEALRRYLTLPVAAGAPPLANAHFRLGQLYALQGNKPLARQSFQQALKLDPKLKEAKDALAKL